MIHVWALIAIITLGASSWLLVRWGGDYSVPFIQNFVGHLGGGLGLLLTAGLSVVYFFLVYSWFGAAHKAAILEREYGVKYSQAEMFFASSVVNTVRELDRRRIEINGDFRRERDPERELPKPDSR